LNNTHNRSIVFEAFKPQEYPAVRQALLPDVCTITFAIGFAEPAASNYHSKVETGKPELIPNRSKFNHS
jgi:hypothetical protein